MRGTPPVGLGSLVHLVDQRRLEIQLRGEQMIPATIEVAAAGLRTARQHHHMHMDVAAVVPAGKNAAEGHDAIAITDACAAAEPGVVVQVIVVWPETIDLVRLLLTRFTETTVIALRITVPYIDFHLAHRQRTAAGIGRAQ